jgi:hypothetical protein
VASSTFSAVDFCIEQQLILCCALQRVTARTKKNAEKICFIGRIRVCYSISSSEGNTVKSKLRAEIASLFLPHNNVALVSTGKNRRMV